MRLRLCNLLRVLSPSSPAPGQSSQHRGGHTTLLTLGQGLANISTSSSRICASLSESCVQLYTVITDLYSVAVVTPSVTFITLHIRTCHTITLGTCNTCLSELTECPVLLLFGGVEPLDHPGTLGRHVSLSLSLSSLAPVLTAHRRHRPGHSVSPGSSRQGSRVGIRQTGQVIIVDVCSARAYHCDSDTRSS